MNPSQAGAIATQRHDIDLAASRRLVSVVRSRTSFTARFGQALIGAGSRLVADRHGSARSTH